MNEPAVARWKITINGKWSNRITAGSVGEAASAGSMLWRTHAAKPGETVDKLTVERL